MGYFSNSTEGDDYYRRYCGKCAHEDLENDIECPVLTAHMLWSEEECDKPDSILHQMIPYRDGRNLRCVFYEERREL